MFLGVVGAVVGVELGTGDVGMEVVRWVCGIRGGEYWGSIVELSPDFRSPTTMHMSHILASCT